MTDANRRWLEGAGSALIAIGFLLSITGDRSIILLYAMFAVGALASAIARPGTTQFSRAVKNVEFGWVILLTIALAVEVLSVDSPFSDTATRRLTVVAVLAGIFLVLTYLFRSGLPAMRDFFRLSTERPPKNTNQPGSIPHPDDGA